MEFKVSGDRWNKRKEREREREREKMVRGLKKERENVGQRHSSRFRLKLRLFPVPYLQYYAVEVPFRVRYQTW